MKWCFVRFEPTPPFRPPDVPPLIADCKVDTAFSSTESSFPETSRVFEFAPVRQPASVHQRGRLLTFSTLDSLTLDSSTPLRSNQFTRQGVVGYNRPSALKRISSFKREVGNDDRAGHLTEIFSEVNDEI